MIPLAAANDIVQWSASSKLLFLNLWIRVPFTVTWFYSSSLWLIQATIKFYTFPLPPPTLPRTKFDDESCHEKVFRTLIKGSIQTLQQYFYWVFFSLSIRTMITSQHIILFIFCFAILQYIFEPKNINMKGLLYLKQLCKWLVYYSFNSYMLLTLAV